MLKLSTAASSFFLAGTNATSTVVLVNGTYQVKSRYSLLYDCGFNLVRFHHNLDKHRRISPLIWRRRRASSKRRKGGAGGKKGGGGGEGKEEKGGAGQKEET